MVGRGRFIWHELLTRDIPGAKSFYGRLFGWKTRETEIPDLGPYTVVHDGDREACGIVHLRQMSEPVRWMPSVWVDDVPGAAKATVFWGGDIRGGPFDVPGLGEILMIRDPNGAELTLVRPDPTTPARADRVRVGSMCHHVLVTLDLDKAKNFYEHLLGWKMKLVEIAPNRKIPIFLVERTRVASMHVLAKPEDGICQWVSGIGVKNLPAAHTKAVQLGAQSLVPPTRFGKLGATDLLVDPTGAPLALFEPAPRATKK